VKVVLAAALGAALLQGPGSPVAEIDLSSPGAISLAAFSGQLDGFMRTTDPVIQGEGGKGHENQIEIDSVDLDVSFDGEIADLRDIRIAKRLDKASPLLFKALTEVDRFEEVTIEFWKKGTEKDRPRKVLVYELAEPFLTQFDQSVAGDVDEQVSLEEAAALAISYFPVDAKGRALPSVEHCWNFTENVSCTPLP
jgi:type VI secretion system Hcp family effector